MGAGGTRPRASAADGMGPIDAPCDGKGDIIGEKRDEPLSRLLPRLYILRFEKQMLSDGA